ncbi:MAG: hypothetical protein J6D54_04825 [Olsenella sp.]|nr:hypothetical protein [Olsenella sp.]
MKRVHSSEPLGRLTYHWLDDGTAIVYLRDNIEHLTVETDGGTTEEWVADEVEVRVDMSREEVEEAFDQLWVKGETESKPLSQRVEEIEELLDATIAVVLGEDEEV